MYKFMGHPIPESASASAVVSLITFYKVGKDIRVKKKLIHA